MKKSWSWRHAIIKSNLPPTTRHVLLTISIYMNDVGGGCYPTIEDLVEATGLSPRAVVDHIGKASELGWIEVSKHGFRGQRWKNNEYRATWPEPVESEAQREQKPRKTRASPKSDPVDNTVENVGKGNAPDALPLDFASESAEVVQLTTKGSAANSAEVVQEGTSKVPDSFQNPSTLRASAREEGGEEDGFQEFWEACPATNRPDNRDHVRKLFLALSPADRLIASSAWETYRRVCITRSKPYRMVLFLKDRLFDVYHDAPPIDRDGEFRITPDRPEWGPWLASVRAEYGDEFVKIAAAAKLMVRKTRWPEGFDPASLVKDAA